MKRKWSAAIKSNLLTIILTVVGAAGGYLYYRFIGCASGTCAITSNPFLSVLFGGVLGGLLGSLFSKNGCGACGSKQCGKDDSCA